MGLLGDDGQSVLFSNTVRHFMVQGHLGPTTCLPADRTISVLTSSIPTLKKKKKKELTSRYCYFKERTTRMHTYFFPRLKHKAEASSQEYL